MAGPCIVLITRIYEILRDQAKFAFGVEIFSTRGLSPTTLSQFAGLWRAPWRPSSGNYRTARRSPSKPTQTQEEVFDFCLTRAIWGLV